MVRKVIGFSLFVGLIMVVGLGCDTVPKSDYDSLASQYRQAQAENSALKSELASARTAKDTAEADLAKLRGQLPPGAELHLIEGRPAIRMEASLLYGSGQAKITPAGQAALRQVASILQSTYRDAEIRVEGHTDTDPIKVTKNKYDTNWDLGSKRANEVVVFLTTKCGIDSSRVYSASYSMYRPISSSKPANRRVEIVVLPPTTGSGLTGSRMTGMSEEK